MTEDFSDNQRAPVEPDPTVLQVTNLTRLLSIVRQLLTLALGQQVVLGDDPDPWVLSGIEVQPCPETRRVDIILWRKRDNGEEEKRLVPLMDAGQFTLMSAAKGFTMSPW